MATFTFTGEVKTTLNRLYDQLIYFRIVLMTVFSIKENDMFFAIWKFLHLSILIL